MKDWVVWHHHINQQTQPPPRLSPSSCLTASRVSRCSFFLYTIGYVAIRFDPGNTHVESGEYTMFIKKALAQQGAHLLGEAIASEFLIRISGPAIPTNVFLMPLSQIGTGTALTGELHIDKAVLIIQEQRRGMWLVYSDDPEPIGAIETNNFLEFTIMSTTPIPKDIRFDSLDENNSNGAVALAATLLYLIQMGMAQMP